MTRRTTLAAIVTLVVAGAVLAYLRDPVWLVTVESGLRPWQTGPDGLRYRWTSGHASFFVPASAGNVTFPLRVPFEHPADVPAQIVITVDDRMADRFELRDDRWSARRIVMPPPAGRRHRRIDLRVDRLRPGNRGVQLGEVVIDGR